MKLFDSITRTDASPRRYTESIFDYLNRADRPDVERIRELVQAWFDDYPDDDKQKLENGFRESEHSEHLGAWWELYVFTLYRKLQ